MSCSRSRKCGCGQAGITLRTEVVVLAIASIRANNSAGVIPDFGAAGSVDARSCSSQPPSSESSPFPSPFPPPPPPRAARPLLPRLVVLAREEGPPFVSPADLRGSCASVGKKDDEGGAGYEKEEEEEEETWAEDAAAAAAAGAAEAGPCAELGLCAFCCSCSTLAAYSAVEVPVEVKSMLTAAPGDESSSDVPSTPKPGPAPVPLFCRCCRRSARISHWSVIPSEMQREQNGLPWSQLRFAAAQGPQLRSLRTGRASAIQSGRDGTFSGKERERRTSPEVGKERERRTSPEVGNEEQKEEERRISRFGACNAVHTAECG